MIFQVTYLFSFNFLSSKIATYFERARCIRKMMQHASILHRQRAPGSMRVLSRATITRLAIPGPEVSLTRSRICLNINIKFMNFLRLLGQQQPKTLYFLVDAKSRVREVYTQTCLHFATQGMLDTELFGLAVLIGESLVSDWYWVGASTDMCPNAE